MKLVEGVSDLWLQKYGENFLKTIYSFCQTKEVNIPMDVHVSAAPKQPMEKIVKVYIYIYIYIYIYKIAVISSSNIIHMFLALIAIYVHVVARKKPSHVNSAYG